MITEHSKVFKPYVRDWLETVQGELTGLVKGDSGVAVKNELLEAAQAIGRALTQDAQAGQAEKEQ